MARANVLEPRACTLAVVAFGKEEMRLQIEFEFCQIARQIVGFLLKFDLFNSEKESLTRGSRKACFSMENGYTCRNRASCILSF